MSTGRFFGSGRLTASRAVASFTEAVPLAGLEGGRIVGAPDVPAALGIGFLGGVRFGGSSLSVPFCFTRCANFEKELLPKGCF